jgi:hypothetical protein
MNQIVNSKILIILGLTALFIGACYQGLAQDLPETEEITVVSSYQPSVSDAFKINTSPSIDPDKIEKPSFNYEVKSFSYAPEASLKTITPAKITGESVSKLYKNYIKAGLGNYTTPYFELFANKLRSKKSSFGAHVKHISSNGKIKDFAPTANSENELQLYGKRFGSRHTFSSEVFYKRKGIHYYGYKPADFPEIDLSKKDIAQHYNLIGFNNSYESNFNSNRKLNHSFVLNYYYLLDKIKTSEHNIYFKTDINKDVQVFDFSEFQQLGVEAEADFYFDKDSLYNANNGIFRVLPYYKLAFSQYRFKLGINTVFESNTTSYMHFYPVVHAEVDVIKNTLTTYAGIRGDMKKNSFKSFMDENPFITPIIEKQFTNYKFDQYGGVKGKITNYFDYNLSFINSSNHNMPFFINDTLNGLENQFTVVYDSIVKYSRVIAEFGFHLNSKLNAMLRGQYNNYFMDKEERPWHKPSLEISFSMNYNIQDKILLNAEVFSRSKMYAKLINYEVQDNNLKRIVTVEKIDGMVDINLGVEYKYSKVLTGFVKFNNILSQRYYHWYNYPSYRFNFLLGVSYSF